MSDWGGLSGRSPALAFAMLMFLLSLGGIPFVAGFWAKIFLFMAAWKAGATGLVILGAMLSVVALYYYMQVGRSIYIEDAPEDRTEITIGRATAWAIGLCVAGIIVMGVMPDTFLSPAQEAARAVGGEVASPRVPSAARFLAPTLTVGLSRTTRALTHWTVGHPPHGPRHNKKRPPITGGLSP